MSLLHMQGRPPLLCLPIFYWQTAFVAGKSISTHSNGVTLIHESHTVTRASQTALLSGTFKALPARVLYKMTWGTWHYPCCRPALVTVQELTAR